MNHLMLLPILAQVKANAPKPGDWRFGWDRVGLIAAAAFAVVFIAWLILRFMARRERRISHSPWCLFKELCAAHRLSMRERQLVTRLAHQHQLEQPAMLFVEPTWWDEGKLTPSWAKCLPELSRLRKKLFALR